MADAAEQELNPLKLLFHAINGSDGISGKVTDFFPAIVYVYDADSKRLKYINRKITDILGYSWDDVASWNNDLTTIVYKDDLELVKTELEKFYSLEGDESYSYNARLNHKQGNWKYFRTMGTVLQRDDLGKASSMLFVAQDVTEEVNSGNQFKRIEELFNDTQEILKFGVWEWEVQENTIIWSNGLYRLLGYDPLTEKDTLVLTPEFYLSHIVEEDREKVIQSQEQRHQRYEYDNYYRIRDRHGRIKNVREKGRVIRNKKDELVRVIGSTMDVTEQLQLYHDLADYKANLEDKIKDLNRSNRELEEFAYVASHDMNEPLRKITTFVERLENKHAQDLSEEGKLYLERIIASAENMRLLIDNLLEFSRTTRTAEPFKKTDLAAVLEEVKMELDLKIEESTASVIAGKLPVIEGIRSQMKQLFNNLLTNSIKFRRPEIPLQIYISAEQLSEKEADELHLGTGKAYYKLTFADNGIGFEEEYCERIFLIFQRLHGKSEYPGTGIGLAICKKITEHHNGLIYAGSDPGNGSVFTVILPEQQ